MIVDVSKKILIVGLGLLAAVAYCFLYLPDKRTFPKLYEK